MKRTVCIGRLLAALPLAALMCAPGVARGAGFAVAEQGTRAAGSGGASTAREGDPAAGWYNPAALADGAGVRLGVGALLAFPAVSASAQDGSWQTDAETGVSVPPHFYVSVARGGNAWGLAAGVPFGSGVSWPADWPGRHEIVASRLEVFRLAPYWARRLDSRWSVALGAHLDFGRMRVQRSLDFIDTDGDVALDMTGFGFGFDAAAFFRATRTLALGLSVKTRSRIALDGTADFETPLAFSGKAQDQHVKSRLSLPDRIALGARWSNGKLALLGDLELVSWSLHQATVLDFERDETTDVRQENNWQTTVAVRAGAEYAVTPRWTARGGAFIDPSPAQDSTAAPSSPDQSRVGLTLGGSRVLGRGLSLDLFYEYLHLMGRASNNPEALAADYSGRAHMLGFGLRYGTN